MHLRTRKRGSKAAKRGLSDEQIPVLICRDRTASTTDFILEKDDRTHIYDALKPILATSTILCTDGSRAMIGVARKMGLTHRPVNLAAGIRVIAGVYHVQNVNAYGSRLKTWMRRFNGVATCHLAQLARKLAQVPGSKPSRHFPRRFLVSLLGHQSISIINDDIAKAYNRRGPPLPPRQHLYCRLRQLIGKCLCKGHPGHRR